MLGRRLMMFCIKSRRCFNREERIELMEAGDGVKLRMEMGDDCSSTRS